MRTRVCPSTGDGKTSIPVIIPNTGIPKVINGVPIPKVGLSSSVTL